MPMDESYLVPPHSPEGGGFYLGWKNDVGLMVLMATKKYIDTGISYKGLYFNATFVYGESDHTKRQAISAELSKLQPSMGGG